jgi:citrate synthase
MSAVVDIRKGLEGVVADTTSLSLVDGEVGRLYYRGYPVEALAQKRFAEVVHLLVFGALPDPEQLARLEEFLWRAGQLPASLAASLRSLASHGAHPMATLQAITPLLALEPPADGLAARPISRRASSSRHACRRRSRWFMRSVRGGRRRRIPSRDTTVSVTCIS